MCFGRTVESVAFDETRCPGVGEKQEQIISGSLLLQENYSSYTIKHLSNEMEMFSRIHKTCILPNFSVQQL